MPVRVETKGEIAVVAIDNPPVNASSAAVRAGLIAAAEEIDADPAVQGAVVIGRGRVFIAGADVSEFDKPPVEPHLPDVVMRIERAAKPWLAAIHGMALGGGLEIAMGCRWRVASPGASLGMPEVNLGLIPGAGGAARLPRLVPIDLAAEMASIGRPIRAEKARDAGLVDAILEGDLEAAAIDHLRQALAGSLPTPTLERPTPPAPDDAFWTEKETAALRVHRGQAAPPLALAALRRAVEGPADAALTAERAEHLRLRASPESQALRYVFFAERAAMKPPVEAAPAALKAVGVVGGGTMGAGIAVALLDAGLAVTLLERDQEALDRGRAKIAETYDRSVERGRLCATARDERLGRLTGALDASALSEADLVIEAVFEDLEVKRDVFRRLDAACKPGAILATNTSYIDPNAIAEAVSRPDAFVGLHFFSPANIMRLLEVVRADTTSDRALATAWALAKKLGKTPVLSGVCEGFIGNRILKAYRAETEALLLAGVAPSAIDRAMRGFGMPMGPMEMQDLAGHDIAAAMRAAARDRGEAIHAPVSDRLVAEGRLGQKTGGGWYDYAQGDRKPRPSPKAEALVAEEVAKAGGPDPAVVALGDDAIAERILERMAAEGRRILDEGIARSEEDVDLVEVHGYGFPRRRGGLMYWRRTRNATKGEAP